MPSLEEFITAARPINPGWSDQEIEQQFYQSYPDQKPYFEEWVSEAEKINQDFTRDEIEGIYKQRYGDPREKLGIVDDALNLLEGGVLNMGKAGKELATQILPESWVEGIDAADTWLRGQSLDEAITENYQQLSPEMRGALQKDWWDEGGREFGEAVTDPRAYMGTVLMSLPETAVSMVPAVKLGKMAYTQSLAQGMSKAGATARAAGVAGMAGKVTEGTMAGLHSGANVRDTLEGMDDQIWMGSEVVQSMMSAGSSFEQAKHEVINNKAIQATLTAGAVTGLFGGEGDKFIAKALTEGVTGSLKSRVAKGAVAEGVLEEFPQSYLSKVAENVSLQDIDPSIGTTEGALNEGLGGLAAGGIMGGGFGLLGRAQEQAAPTYSPDTPAEEILASEATIADELDLADLEAQQQSQHFREQLMSQAEERQRQIDQMMLQERAQEQARMAEMARKGLENQLKRNQVQPEQSAFDRDGLLRKNHEEATAHIRQQQQDMDLPYTEEVPAYVSEEIPLPTAEEIATDLPNIPFSELRKMKKPDLVAAAEQRGINHEEATVDELLDAIDAFQRGSDIDRAAAEKPPVDPSKGWKKKPLHDWIRSRGGVNPDSPIGRELKNLDIRYPGFFQKSGMNSLDGIVQDEHEIFDQFSPSEDTNGYVEEQLIVDMIERETAGEPLRTVAQQSAYREYETQLADFKRRQKEGDLAAEQEALDQGYNELSELELDREEYGDFWDELSAGNSDLYQKAVKADPENATRIMGDLSLHPLDAKNQLEGIISLFDGAEDGRNNSGRGENDGADAGQHDARGEEDAAVPDRVDAQVQQEAQHPFELDTQTEESLRREAEERLRQVEQEAAEQKAAEGKEQADREVDSFALTDSSLPEGTLPGQEDLLAQPDTVAVEDAPDYETRYRDRIERINAAASMDEAKAIQDEELSDDERHFEGTNAVQQAVNRAGLRGASRKVKDEEVARLDAGEWIQERELPGSGYEANQKAQKEAGRLNGLDDGFEYRARLPERVDEGREFTSGGKWVIEKRKKPTKQDRDLADEWVSLADQNVALNEDRTSYMLNKMDTSGLDHQLKSNNSKIERLISDGAITEALNEIESAAGGKGVRWGMAVRFADPVAGQLSPDVAAEFRKGIESDNKEGRLSAVQAARDYLSAQEVKQDQSAITEAPPSEGLSDSGVEITLQKNGNPYKSETQAGNAIRIRKGFDLETHEPVETEGGWGIRQRQNTPGNEEINEKTLELPSNDGENAIKRGEIGELLSEGDVRLTQTGRETTPFPKVDATTPRKTANAVKRAEAWLISNAVDEAKARGDDFNLLQFENMNLSNLSPADKDSAEMYLFGDYVPEVPGNITKPLQIGSQEKDSNETSAKEKIHDVGEKIGGARKDMWGGFRDTVERDLSDDEILKLPLSKSFPEPNYQKLAEEGVDLQSLALIKAMRDEIPTKGRSRYKQGQYKRGVLSFRDTASKILNDEGYAQQMMDEMRKTGGLSKLANRVDLMLELGFPQSGVDLSGVTLERHYFSLYQGKKNVSKWIVDDTAKSKKSFGGMGGHVAATDTREEAVEALKGYLNVRSKKSKGNRSIKFEVYKYRGKESKRGWIVGKKNGRNYLDMEEGFESSVAAREYIDNNQQALEDKLAKLKEIPAHRKAANDPRVGDDYRQGKDVSADEFREHFGFRGVEFGNWVEQDKRQNDLNEAYDGLMDLALLLDVPPKAISLNGELGLAFGARGIGGKDAPKAHYEPGKIVINLTKKDGAGSLAHEWWHSLDNYFSRMRGESSQHMTENPKVYRKIEGGQWVESDDVRPEMVRAFKGVVDAIHRSGLPERAQKLDERRTKSYWGTDVEMSARTFESYIIGRLKDKELSNDYLANIVSPEYWSAAESLGLEAENSYPYLLQDEMEAINTAYDSFFATVETKETDQGVAMYSKSSILDSKPKGISVKEAEQVVDEFKRQFPGSEKLDITVSSNQEDVFGPDGSIENKGIIKGAHWPASKRVVIIASNLRDSRDARRTLQHEVLAHSGLNLFEPEVKRKILEKVADSDSALALGPMFSEVRKNGYDDADPLLVAEEVIAFTSEQVVLSDDATITDKVKAAWDKVVHFIVTQLRKMGFMEGLYTKQEMRDLVEAMAEGMRRNAPQRTFPQSDDAQFSKRMDEDEESLVDDLKEAAQDKWDGLSTFAKEQWWGALTLRQTGHALRKVLPKINGEYIESLQRMEATKNQWKRKAEVIVEDRRKLKKKESERLSRLQHEATIAGVDPAEKYSPLWDSEAGKARIQQINVEIKREQTKLKTGFNPAKLMVEKKMIQNALKNEPQREKDYNRLEQMWRGLSVEAQEVYRQERDHHTAVAEAMKDALIERIMAADAPEETKKGLMDKLRLEFEEANARAPYFPLARFGKYWASTGHGKNRTFDMFETEAEQKRFVDLMESEGVEVTGSGKQLTDLKDLEGVDPDFVTDVDSKIAELGGDPRIEELRDSIYQLYLRSLPELSARKHYIHRKKIQGFYKDQLRAFADKATHDANHIGRLIHGPAMENALNDSEKAINLASSSGRREKVQSEIDEIEAILNTMEDMPEHKLRDILKDLQQGLQTDDSELKFKGRFFKIPNGRIDIEQMEERLEVMIDDRQQSLDAAALIKQDDVNYASNGLDEVRKAHREIMNPKVHPITQALNSIGFAWFLGATPAAAIVNLTQTPLVSMPMMAAKYGWRGAQKQLFGAAKQLTEGKGSIESKLSREEQGIYQRLMDEGIIDKTMAHDLAGVAEAGIDTGSFKHRIGSAMSFMFHHAERINREITAIAMYRLAKESGKSSEAAYKQAVQMVMDSHFDYTSSNRARFMRGNFGRVALQFRQYSQNITYTYGKLFWESFKAQNLTAEERSEARKALGGMMAMQFTFAGSLGLPLAGMVTGTAQVMEEIFGDEDEPEEVKAEYRQWLADTFGETGGRFIAKGAFDAFTPIAMHGRITLSDLWIRTGDRDLEGRAHAQELQNALLGPMASIFTNFVVGWDLMLEGKVDRGVEYMMPKFIKDAMKSGRYAAEGARTMSGTKLKDVSAEESFFKAMGFSSSDLSDMYEQRNIIGNLDNKQRDRRKSLIDSMAQARTDQDREEIRSIQKEITAWNRKHPEAKITFKTIQKSMLSKQRYQEQMVNGTRRTNWNADLVDKYTYAN